MNIEDFLAIPGTPCIRLRVGPNPYDEIEVGQLYFDENKEALRDYCESLGDVTAYDWRAMKKFTKGNGVMAKLLIALGDLAGAWQMHPPREHGMGLWTKDHPRVLQISFFSSVAKPSRGDTDTHKLCFCCERPMGPPGSVVHDLPAAVEEPTMCFECVSEGCELEQGPCHVFPEKKASERRQRPPEDEESPAGEPAGLEAYLRQFE